MSDPPLKVHARAPIITALPIAHAVPPGNASPAKVTHRKAPAKPADPPPTALTFSPGNPSPQLVPPRHLQQLWCVAENGAALRFRDAGVPNPEEFLAYDRACRLSVGYDGPAITEVSATTNLSNHWDANNRDTIIALHAELGNDLETLARMFSDPRIIDDGTIGGRADAILSATQTWMKPGVNNGIAMSDVGFAGDQGLHGAGFRDPHPSSRNQVGHFLTGVRLAWDPKMLEDTVAGLSLRSILGADPSVSNRDLALRLIIGHELRPDPIIDPIHVFREQLNAVKDQYVDAFLRADAALGNAAVVNLAAADRILHEIPIDPTGRGNSYQDLRLSLLAWHFGRMLGAGKFVDGAAATTWLRQNLGPGVLQPLTLSGR